MLQSLFSSHITIDHNSKKKKFPSHDQEEEYVSCPASLRMSVNNWKKLKCERTCAAHARWYIVHAYVTVHTRARGSQNIGKIVG